MRLIYEWPENFRETLTMPTASFPEIFDGLFFRLVLWICIVTFEVCLFTRSWDNWRYPKNFSNYWIRPRCLFSKMSHRLLFGWTLWMFRPNLKKRQRGRIQGLPKLFGVPPIISGRGKATNVKFCAHIHGIDRNKSPLKVSGNVSVGVLRDFRKFSGHHK